jgi:hypothetical protein
MTNINLIQICSYRYFLKLKSEKYSYKQRSFWYRPGVYLYQYGKTVPATAEEMARDGVYLEGETVYFKPFVEFRMANNSTETKFFEDKDELVKFLKSNAATR